MPKISVALVIFLFVSLTAFSQKSNLSGILQDVSKKAPVYNSVVPLLTPK
jgi:hypothetical protein